MRFVPTEQLNETMRVAKAVYSDKGILYLKQGSPLVPKTIDKLKEFGYSGVYVEDEVSQGIQLNDAIPYELRMEAVKRVKEVIEHQKPIVKNSDLIKEAANLILQCMIKNRGKLCNVVDVRNYNDYLYKHCVNVGVISCMIGMAFNLNMLELEQLTMAGLMHDIGMRNVDQGILKKDGKLTGEEYNQVKNHVRYSYQCLEQDNNLQAKARVAIRQHHERMDGTGYPEGLMGEDISFYGKILAIADVFDAMTSAKTYKKAVTPLKAFDVLIRSSGSQFDMNVIRAFAMRTAVYPNGATIKLSNGQWAIVVSQNQQASTRPVIRMIPSMQQVDLVNDHEIAIVF